MTVAKIFEREIQKYPNKIAFLMDDIKLTFNDVSIYNFRMI